MTLWLTRGSRGIRVWLGWAGRGVVVMVGCALPLAAVACSSSTPMPTTPSGQVGFSSCGSLQSNTAYTLKTDLSSSSATCLLIQSATSVQLDCQQHVVPNISVINGSGVTLRNCTVTGVVSITTSHNVDLTMSTVSGGVIVGTSTSVLIDHSTISAPINATIAVQIVAGTNDQLQQDTISLSGNGGFEAVYLAAGTGNEVLQSTVTGTYAETFAQAGPDDGILLDGESGDTIRGNIINGFWDTAVEGIDTIANTSINDNTMSKIGTAAIGSYWCTNWTNNTVQSNTVSEAPRLIFIYYETGTPQCGGSFPPPVFAGNQFVSNTLQDVIPGLGFVNIPKMSVVFASGHVENNVLQGNNFGTYDGPFLSPLSGFTDGGGNICGPLNPSLTNFVCSGGSGAVHRRRR